MGLAVDGANRHDMRLVRATLDSVPMPDRRRVRRLSRACAWTRGLRLWRGSPHVGRVWLHRPHPQSGRTGVGARRQRRSSGQPGSRRGAGWWTHPQLAEPVSAHSGALGQGPRELHRLPSFRLCPHRPQSCRIIRIGSKPRIRQPASPGCNQLYPTEITLNNPVYKVLAHHLVTLGVGMQVVR